MNNNQKATKRALLTSVMALVMCVVMLVGTTFAWFTDTASTGVNKIQAGNLDIELMNEAGTTPLDSATALKWKTKDTGEVLWEPNCKYELEGFQIKNAGNLAVKYKVVLKATDITKTADGKSLLDVIDWTIKLGSENVTVTKEQVKNGLVNGVEILVDKVLAPKGLSDVISVTGHMDANAGNDYQGLKIGGFGITVLATQASYEKDSIDEKYDKDATYPVVVSRNELNTTLTLDNLKDENGKVSPVEVTLGDTSAADINYSESSSGYTGKGVMLGSTKLNKYAAAPAEEGQYKFTFKDGTINSAATGYVSIDNYTDTSVYMLVPGNSDVVFENMTFNGVVSFDIQKYTSPWSNLNSITFKNCIFEGLIVGTCPAANVTFDGCEFKSYTNTEYANNSNPIWWRSDMYDLGAADNRTPIKSFTFVNNTVVGTRPIKIERVGMWDSEPVFTFKNNTFDIKAQADDTEIKNMAINIGQKDGSCSFTLIDEGNTISDNTAALYTAARGSGSNQYFAVSGNRVLDGNGNKKDITAKEWKTGVPFELKSVD